MKVAAPSTAIDNARWFSYAVAVGATLVATLVRIAMAPLAGSSLPFFTYFVTTLFVAWYVGWRPALLSILLSIGHLFVSVPGNHVTLFLTTSGDRVTLLGFLFGTAVATFLFDLQRRTLERVEQEAMRRKAEIESRIIHTRCGSSIGTPSGSLPSTMRP
jgi:glucose-6-phosphate-specific signal transduction histidine kinase